MKREERIKELAWKITNTLIDCDDFTYEDMACSIAYLVGVVDRLSEKANKTKSGAFSKMAYDMIGEVCNASSDKPAWRQSTEHPLVDEEVIDLVGENKRVADGDIVDKNKGIECDGGDIPNGKCWIPCPKIEED